MSDHMYSAYAWDWGAHKAGGVRLQKQMQRQLYLVACPLYIYVYVCVGRVFEGVCKCKVNK